jgi:hypothetical protein
LFATVLLVQGCLKDHCSRTIRYKIYTPEYIPLSEARSMAGTLGPTPLVTTGKIFYHKGYLFIGEPNKGIHVIDDRDPSRPANIAFLRVPGNLDMAVSGEVLYADSYVDMLSFDLSDPSRPQLLGRTRDVFPVHRYGYGFTDDPAGRGVVTGFKVTDTLISYACPVKSPGNSGGPEPYDVYYDGGYYTISNSTATPPGIAAGKSVGGSTSRFAVDGQYLYAVLNDSLRLYNISVPSHPVYDRSIPVDPEIQTIFSYRGYLYMGAGAGVAIFDNSRPASPVQVSTFQHITACDPVVVQNITAYATIRSGASCHITGSTNKLLVFSVYDPASPRLAKEMELTNPGGLAVAGDELIVTDGKGGIRFLDVSVPSNPHLVTTVKGPDSPSDVIILDSTVLVVARDGLYQYHYKNGETPSLLSRLGVSGT